MHLQKAYLLRVFNDYNSMHVYIQRIFHIFRIIQIIISESSHFTRILMFHDQYPDIEQRLNYMEK